MLRRAGGRARAKAMWPATTSQMAMAVQSWTNVAPVRHESGNGSYQRMIAPVTSITGEIMLLAVSSPAGTVPPLELRAYAEYDLRNKLLAVPGVSQVSVIGGELPEYQVLVQQENLRLYDLTVNERLLTSVLYRAPGSREWATVSLDWASPRRVFAATLTMLELVQALAP